MKKSTIKKAIGVGLGAACAGAGLCGFVFYEVIDSRGKLFTKIGDAVSAKNATVPQSAEPDGRKQWFNEQNPEILTILSVDGQKLRGYLYPADKPSDVYVFCSHGYRSSGKREYSVTTKYYHDKGFNVLIVDHRSLGESEGKYIGFGYHESRDSINWLNYLISRFGEGIQIIMHGVSMGSATVMLMCGDENLPANVKFAIADCGYTSAWNEFAHNLSLAHVPTFPLLNGVNAVSRVFAKYDFKDTDTLAAVSRADIPMLFVHGKDDTFVPTYMAQQLFDAYGGPYKDLLLVDGAWHAESYRKNSAAYEEKINEFVDKFIQKK